MGELRDADGNVISQTSQELRDASGNVLNRPAVVKDLSFQDQQKFRSPNSQSPSQLSMADRIKAAMQPYKGGSETIDPKEATSFPIPSPSKTSLVFIP